MTAVYYVRIEEDPRPGAAYTDELGCRIVVSDEPWRGDLAVTGPDAVTPDRIEAAARRKLGLPLMIARTERLFVRELRPEDFEAVRAIPLRPGEFSLLGPGAETLFARDSFCAYVTSQYAFFGFGIWGMFDRKSCALAGLIGFAPGDPPEFGLCTALPYRRTGFGEEAAKAVFGYAMEELGFSGCSVRVRAANLPAMNFARKLKTSLGKTGGHFQIQITIL